ncbi:substrate-binding domain-containing protein [Oscillospiraceae bacterium HV4-5-C5C]|nr:substrate-binding domain-containing protein [Oscillospiraceae bacterium HV4-5-C5C]
MKKSLQLNNQLKNDLMNNNWKEGQRFYSENQLCQKYGLSRQTVRQALSALTEEGLLVSRKGSGTFVTAEAVNRRFSRTRTIGILVTYLSDYIFPIIIKELERIFTAEGYYVYLASTRNSVAQERKLLEAMLDKNVDGIILEPTKSALPNPNHDLYSQLLKRNYPLITINSAYPDLPFPQVSLDDDQAGFIAAQYLLQCGHKQIGGLFKSDDMQGHLRYRGFQRALLQSGAAFADEQIYWYTTEDLADLDIGGDQILRRLSDCSAVVTYNDQIAIRLIDLFQQHGIRVPQDVSIVSIDDSRLASVSSVPLTSVRNPSSEVGKVAARNLLRLINGQNFDAGQSFAPQLVVRKSVCQPSLPFPGQTLTGIS